MIKKFIIEPAGKEHLYFEKKTGYLWFKTNSRVLYADTDAARVVYHANYLRYFEIGRAEILRNYGENSYKEIEDQNIFHPIVHVNMDFHHPASYDELLDIYVRPKQMEIVKFTIEYKIFNAQTHQNLVEGETVHCCTIGGKKVCPVDEITKGLFKSFRVEMPVY